MKKDGMSLTVLGARGSIPVSKAEQTLFGGATSCYMVQAGDETIFLDAGSGLPAAPSQVRKAPVILLSHLHLDHVIGLGMYPRLSQPGAVTRLLLKADTAEDALSQLAGLYSPPFWPLPLTQYEGRLLVEPLPALLRVGDVTVESMEGCHPGGCLVFRLQHEGKRLVYATDFERDETAFERLIRFCHGSDLLLFDAQYTAEEAAARKGYGHSSAETGLELLEHSGSKRLLLIHHDPYASDEELLRRERQLNRANVRYAREGEEYAV